MIPGCWKYKIFKIGLQKFGIHFSWVKYIRGELWWLKRAERWIPPSPAEAIRNRKCKGNTKSLRKSLKSIAKILENPELLSISSFVYDSPDGYGVTWEDCKTDMQLLKGQRMPPFFPHFFRSPTFFRKRATSRFESTLFKKWLQLHPYIHITCRITPFFHPHFRPNEKFSSPMHDL